MQQEQQCAQQQQDDYQQGVPALGIGCKTAFRTSAETPESLLAA